MSYIAGAIVHYFARKVTHGAVGIRVSPQVRAGGLYQRVKPTPHHHSAYI